MGAEGYCGVGLSLYSTSLWPAQPLPGSDLLGQGNTNPALGNIRITTTQGGTFIIWCSFLLILEFLPEPGYQFGVPAYGEEELWHKWSLTQPWSSYLPL